MKTQVIHEFNAVFVGASGLLGDQISLFGNENAACFWRL